jgi:tRNA A-37 threonylcarbamoyl transferase component Bud32
MLSPETTSRDLQNGTPGAKSPDLQTSTSRDLEDSWKVIIMEYVEGVLLLRELRNLLQSERSKIVQDIAKALDILHSNDLVHGDIRVPNILVTRDVLRIYIIDFDFTGLDRKALYPSTIDLSIFTWVDDADGVDSMYVLKSHDIHAFNNYCEWLRISPPPFGYVEE